MTEKATSLSANLNQYTFDVAPTATRTQVAAAVEKVFSVKVARVNIINHSGKERRARNMRGRPGRTPDVKKAIVTLKQGEAINLI